MIKKGKRRQYRANWIGAKMGIGMHVRMPVRSRKVTGRFVVCRFVPVCRPILR